MKILEERILKDGVILNNEILKVDSFINHQIDVKLLRDISAYISAHFKGVNKIVTIETSGIPFAIGVAQQFDDCPVVFAKKSKSAIVDENNIYTAEVKSFTRKTNSTISIDKRFLSKGDKVLIVDDFLAEGNAGLALASIIKEAGVELVGFATVIEKVFQGGRKRLESQGIKVVACASIGAFIDNKPVFVEK